MNTVKIQELQEDIKKMNDSIASLRVTMQYADSSQARSMDQDFINRYQDKINSTKQEIQKLQEATSL